MLLQRTQVALQQFTLLQQVGGVLDLGLQCAGHLCGLVSVELDTAVYSLGTQYITMQRTALRYKTDNTMNTMQCNAVCNADKAMSYITMRCISECNVT